MSNRQPLAALQYCSCTAGRNSQFTQPRLRCHVTETLPVLDTHPPSTHTHTHTGQYNFSHFYLPLLLHSEKTNRQQQQEFVMAQPGKRKPSLVWDFFEKLDDGSGKCISGGIFFCGISGGIFFWRYFWRYFCDISGIFTIQVRYRNDGISCFKYRI